MPSPRPEHAQAIVPLAAYQERAAMDRARFLYRLWPRQSGKSFGISLKCILDVIETGKSWVWLSSGERMSQELIEAGAKHAAAVGIAAETLAEDYKIEEDKFTAHVLRFPGGAKITGLPANPKTARGHSANVWLDELATHKDSRAIWTALYPTITRGYRLIITTTPLGKTNRAYELCEDWAAKQAAGNAAYSVERLSIYDCVAQGLVLRDHEGNPTTPEDLRDGLGDEEAWQQEYLCQFLDEAAAWLSYDQIVAVEDPEIPALPEPLEIATRQAEAAYQANRGDQAAINAAALGPLSGWIAADEELYLGLDIARRRHFSVFWLLRREAPVLRSRAVLGLRNTPFAVQQAVLFALLSLPQVRRACVDRSGLGMQLAESAADTFGEWRAEGVDFSPANKEALAGILRRHTEDRQLRIPARPEIRNSLHSVKRIPTSTGAFRFDAEQSEATGHADHFWALALACQAASGSGVAAADVGSDEVEEIRRRILEDPEHPDHETVRRAESREPRAERGAVWGWREPRVPGWMGGGSAESPP